MAFKMCDFRIAKERFSEDFILSILRRYAFSLDLGRPSFLAAETFPMAAPLTGNNALVVAWKMDTFNVFNSARLVIWATNKGETLSPGDALSEPVDIRILADPPGLPGGILGSFTFSTAGIHTFTFSKPSTDCVVLINFKYSDGSEPLGDDRVEINAARIDFIP